MQLAEDEVLPPFLLQEESARHSLDDFREWLVTHRPDAVITDSSLLAEMWQKLGSKAPSPVGFVSMNVHDLPFDAGIDQNAREIGRIGMLEVIGLLHNHELGIPGIAREILVSGTWMDGKSLPPR